MSATRKLLTVFYADVAGYSRLTGVDEEGTHQRVMAVLDHATEAIVAAQGAVLRYSGDAILASFPSVVKAVETSISIQNQLAEINRAEDQKEPIQIRIGINMGDVLEDRGEVFGEGVNLAARLESASPAGGICISSLVHGQVSGKLDVAFQDGGEIEFKNIKEPARVYYWSPEGLQPSPGAAQSRSIRRKPTIAVLPLVNMSGDPEQEHFADGLSEDLITALSRKHWYDVAARNSTFAYKGQSVDVRSLGESLGVDFVLEDYTRALGVLQEINGLNYFKKLLLAACHAARSDESEARAAMTEVLRACPDLRLNNLNFFRSYREESIAERFRQAFEHAGLPLD